MVEAPEQTEEEQLRVMFPSGFGKQKERAADVGDAHASLRRAPPPGAHRHPGGGGGEGGEEEEEDEEAEGGAEDPYNLPVSHEALLTGHSRLVTALAVEQSGGRLVSGGLDFGVRLYDFAGMKRDLKPFRELEPCGAHQIHALSWSPNGENFVVISGSAEPKVIDRDGREQGWFVRGDMYIRDARHTKGHIMGCTGGSWHPTDRSTVLTSSEDGTLRTWDVSRINSEGGAAGSRCQTSVIKPTAAKPGRWAVTACCWSIDGRVIAGAVADGSLQLWSATQGYSSAAVGQVMPPRAQGVSQQNWSYTNRTMGCAKGVHAGGDAAEGGMSSLVFKRDGTTLASRSGDGCVRLWDIRRLQAPVAQLEGLCPGGAHAGLTFSPDEQLLVVPLGGHGEGGAGGGAGAGAGAGLAFYETSTMKLVRRLGLPAAQAGPVGWHARLNQIFVGAGGRADGGVRCLYSPDFSERGCLLAAARAPRVKEPMDLLPALEPEYIAADKSGGRKRQREAAVEKLKERRIPQRPAGAYGAGGRVGGGTGGTLLTQHLMRAGGNVAPAQEGDVREAILRHSAASELVDTAYAETQPHRNFAEPDPEEEEEFWGEAPK